MEKELARFTVRIFSTENGSWQGEILSENQSFRFQSELQLLRWVHATYPELIQDALYESGITPSDISSIELNYLHACQIGNAHIIDIHLRHRQKFLR